MSDTDQRYDVVFRGDIAPGEDILGVKEKLAKLFNADNEQIERLFSGRPVVVKKNVDSQTAQQYQRSLTDNGAIVSLRPTAATSEMTEATTVESTATQPDEKDVGLLEVGSELLFPEERRDLTPQQIDTSSLSMAPVGEDVLAEDEKRSFEEKQIDLSHLSLDDSSDA